MRDKRSNIWVL